MKKFYRWDDGGSVVAIVDEIAARNLAADNAPDWGITPTEAFGDCATYVGSADVCARWRDDVGEYQCVVSGRTWHSRDGDSWSDDLGRPAFPADDRRSILLVDGDRDGEIVS